MFSTKQQIKFLNKYIRIQKQEEPKFVLTTSKQEVIEVYNRLFKPKKNEKIPTNYDDPDIQWNYRPRTIIR